MLTTKRCGAPRKYPPFGTVATMIVRLASIFRLSVALA